MKGRRKRKALKSTEMYFTKQELKDDIFKTILPITFITSLHLDYNNITSVPVEIHHLRHIVFLNLYGNQIEVLFYFISFCSISFYFILLAPIPILFIFFIIFIYIIYIYLYYLYLH